MRSVRRLLVVLVALVLAAASCGDDDDGDDAAAVPTTAPAEAEGEDAAEGEAGDGGTSLEVTAVDYAFEGLPEEIEGGRIDLRFTNDGEVEHELAFVERGDTELEAFLVDFGPVIQGGPFPDYAERVALPAMVGPGETLETTFLLPAGSYAVICAIEEEPEGEAPEDGEEGAGQPHFELGMATTVEVTEGDASATLPESEGSITARDYGFEVDVEAGEQVVAFVNEGPEQVHHAAIVAFSEGVDEETATEVLTTFLTSEDPEAPPPPELDVEAEGLDTGIFSAGLGQTVTMTFEPSRTYAALCFIGDREGGPPHAIAHGMHEVFTVE